MCRVRWPASWPAPSHYSARHRLYAVNLARLIAHLFPVADVMVLHQLAQNQPGAMGIWLNFANTTSFLATETTAWTGWFAALTFLAY